MFWLEILSHIAAVATAAVAVFAYGGYRLGKYQQRRRLETYLREAKAMRTEGNPPSVLSLVAELGMTEAQVLDASFRSKRIRRQIVPDTHSRDGSLRLEYMPRDVSEGVLM